jgi:ParB family chromosome partitioning protein
MMDLELGQLELRYEKLRRRNSHKERRLVASLAEKGQLLPVVVVGPGEGGSYVLLDGYKRVRALKSLRHDVVRATLWDLAEIEALLLERLMRTSEADSALDQGWLLEELNERFALSHEELARRFDKSQSWVSRRLALVRALPRVVQERVRCGALPAHAAMKYLVPMARAKRTDCERLVAALGKEQPSTRQVGALYAAWVSGNKETRELVVTQPFVVLRACEQARDEKASEKTPGRCLLDDFGILAGTSRRAHQRLAQGLLGRLLPTEEQQAQRAARLAHWECDALFRAAAVLLDATAALEPPRSMLNVAALPPPPEEITHAG